MSDVMTLPELIDAYWDLGYLEGQQGRNYDNVAGDAQRIRSRIDAHLAQHADILAAHDALVIRLHEVTTRLEAAERDAARWRHVRRTAFREFEPCRVWLRFGAIEQHEGPSRLTEQWVDDSVDAAMRDITGKVGND